MKELQYEILPCTTIDDGADAMIMMAKAFKCRVNSTFNSWHLTALPTSTREDVTREWAAAARRSYFGGDR